ncbi:MAG: biotin--[acetyl-CoA-carboxylase] ligase [Solirubrobacteraceae bacterium]|jgi:BirA family biotin operon repressor/biotin-[acetyl-CoA-carboxylase] ligase
MMLGSPRIHHRRTGSTNAEARTLAHAGAPHGTLVTAAEQTAGRGREGRRWLAPPGSALLCSLVLRDVPSLVSLRAGVAVADALAADALLKWPNDVLIDGRKVSGILIESSPREAWAVLGIGINVAVSLGELPEELRETAGTLGLATSAIEPLLARLLETLDGWLGRPQPDVLNAWRSRDALTGAQVAWAGGEGTARGVDEEGRLLVERGEFVQALNAGEVRLKSPPSAGP